MGTREPASRELTQHHECYVCPRHGKICQVQIDFISHLEAHRSQKKMVLLLTEKYLIISINRN